jgi:Ca-activated chloride channel family protein
MAAEDFTIKGKRVNRLAVVKNVVEEFIQQRSSDRIGLIAFAGLAYVVSPLTTDYDWLSANLERIELGLIKDGTAIGSGIISSISRLKKSEAKSKIVIILTDGINNAGKIDPLKAAEAAKVFGIKIYTIGAGSADYVPFPVQNLFGRIIYRKVLIELDEETLKEIARITGGKYFRATDEKSLRNIYNEIDALEKTTIENTGYKEHKENFQSFLLMAMLLIALEVVLSNSLFMKAP